MIFLRWVGEYRSTIISVVAALVSIAAFIVALKAYRLNREVAGRAGRLRELLVAKLAVGTRHYSRGFKAINGPDEITITSVLLRIDYHIVPEDRASDARRFIRYLRPASFELLGMQSPVLPMRLAPYDEAIWKLPPWRALDLPGEVIIGKTTYAQCIHLQLKVTASGAAYVSDELIVGHHFSMLRSYSTDTTPDQRVEELLENTQSVFLAGGQLMLGLHQWIKNLIESAATDSGGRT